MGNVKSRDSKAAIRQALRDVWIPDGERDGCFNCRAPFTVTVRRHHCRSCGELFCKQCWTKKVDLPPSLFPDLAPGARQQQNVCDACSAVLGLQGSLSERLWADGIAVKVASAELKTRGGGLKSSASSVKQEVDDTTYRLRLERWRPFNRLTCVAVQRVDEPRRRSATLPPQPSPRLPAAPQRGATLSAVSEAALPSSMPDSFSRVGGTGRARGFARAVSNNDVNGPPSPPSSSAPPRRAVSGLSGSAGSPDLGPATAPDEPTSTVSFARPGTPPSTTPSVSVNGYLAAGHLSASPSSQPTPATGRLPDSWESPLGELVSISIEYGRGGAPAVRCETKRDVVCYAPTNVAEAIELEQALTLIARVARQRSIVRVSENSSRALSSGGRATTGSGSR